MGSPGGRRTIDERGQSTVLGYVLVLSMVVAGTAAVLVLGAGAIDDTRDQSELERAEHAMTLFDSRTAMVALGTSSTQTVSFGQDSGSFSADDDAGYVALYHDNYTNSSGGETEQIYNRSLGAVVYGNGDTEIAYQGGGVWRRGATGQARLISPPEFHYRRATLTFPIIRVTNDAAASGAVRGTVRTTDSRARSVFPNRTSLGPSPPNVTGSPYNYSGSTYRDYGNPVSNGTVYAKIKSEYYKGWASYFRERTSGNVTVWDHNNTVRLDLLTLGGAPGAFDLPDTGESVEARGIAGGHPITNFRVAIDLDKNNPHFSFYAQDNGREFEVHLYSDVNPNSGSTCPNPSEDVHVGVYYYDGDGTNEYEAFETATPLDPDTSTALEWQCRGPGNDDLWLVANFTDDSADLTYDAVGSRGSEDPGIDDPNCGTSTGETRGNKYAFNDHMEDCDGSGWEQRDTATWDQHQSEVAMEPSTYDEGVGDTETLNNTVNHYMELMGPDVALVVKTGPGSSDPVNEDPSTGELVYEESTGGQYIAYLHVTENDVQVEFE